MDLEALAVGTMVRNLVSFFFALDCSPDLHNELLWFSRLW
jgi:hypothetical protein